MTDTLTVQLMFQGRANVALDLYDSAIAPLELLSRTLYGPDEMGENGQVKTAWCRIGNVRIHCFDSPVPHDFDFTPSTSLCLALKDKQAVADTFAKLADGGTVLMPLDSYDFSPWFGWVQDCFGVSWQLSVTAPGDAKENV
ncbi:VOC family protein [Alcanivorax sp.]|uniref:VOC family protein n=1 Tax=Alcanivorax sp. TaxID=1872427 RepID=UPI000C121434|nr:VOC family protein [Alcanivorax sp.]PHR64428.1 MAG: hypothetical protein COA55_13930 [Alcanivorax sp.]